MKAWFSDLWGGLLLRTGVFEGLRARSDAFFRGFLVVVVIALLVALPALVRGVVDAVRPPAEQIEAARAEFRQGFDMILSWLELLDLGADVQQEALAQIEEGFDLGMQVATEVDALPTILPKPIGGVLEAVGAWASRPFADGGLPLAGALLATWLGYGIWVMLAAKLLGGKGSLQGFFGATALYAAPHALGVFSWVPFLGAVLGLVAFVWGVAIYVKATAVSHDLTIGRALLAVALPALVVILLVILAVLLFVSVIAVSN